MAKTARKSVTKEKTTEVGELKQSIWAVLDDSGCRLIDVNYAEAEASVSKLPGTIITADAARRII
jgi:hypothetical protein